MYLSREKFAFCCWEKEYAGNAAFWKRPGENFYGWDRIDNV